MATSNFKIFNPNKANMIDDAAYDSSLYRQNGVTPGIAPSAMHNKMFYQWSMMCAAFGQFVANQGFEASDDDLAQLTDNITQAFLAIANSNILFWQPNTIYAAGDIVYSKNSGMIRWFYCTQAGISGAIEPAWAEDGQTTIDNTVRWSTRAGGASITAEKLKIPRKINGVFFDGTENITIPAGGQVAIVTGTGLRDGATIPRPAGYEREQCHYFVSPGYMWDDVSSKDILGFQCYVYNIDRVYVRIEDKVSPSSWANYMTIGIKN